MTYKLNPFTGKLDTSDGPQGPAGVVSAAGPGSQGSPSISFAADLDTGLYNYTPNGIAVSTAGTGRLFIDANGNVGVGTTSPGTNLQVQGSGTCDIRIRSAGASAPTSLQFWARNSADNAVRQSHIIGTESGLSFATATTNNTTPTERLRVDTSGRLLVGTSTARANLFNSNITTALQVEGTTDNNSAILVATNRAAANGPRLDFAKSRGSTIGSNTLVSNGDNTGSINFQGSDGSQFVACAAIGANVDGTPGANDMPGRLVFSTTADGASSPTERLRIDSSGRVGVGTTSPSNLLTVSGSGTVAKFISSGSDVSLGFQNASSNAGYLQYASDNLVFWTNNTERARLDSSGRLLVGTSSAFDTSAVFEAVSTSNVVGQFCRTNGVEGAITIQTTPGTLASPSANNADTSIGALYFRGYDSTAWRSGANIKAQTDGQNWASGDCPTRLVFSVTADGSASPTEALRITNDRYVRLASGTGGIQFNGDTAAANALDDYEEGTFTPTLLTDGGVSVTLDVTAEGYYRKIGSIVHMWGTIKTTTNLNSSNYYQLGTAFTSTLASATHVGTASSSTNAGNANQKSVFSVTSRTSGGFYFVRVSPDYDFSNEDGFSFFISTSV